MNAYVMLELIRDRVGEAVASSGIGSGSSQFLGDGTLLAQLNLAQRKAWMELNLQPVEFSLTSTTLTPANSVITLPSNCAKPVYMEETSTGYPFDLKVSLEERKLYEYPLDRSSSRFLTAYRLGNTLVVNQDSYTTGVTLWYRKRIIDLIASLGDTSSTTNTLVIKSVMRPSVTNDYYNGATLEVVGGTGIGSYTVSDYVGSTRTLTVTGTFSTDSLFGTVSDLPQEAEDYIMESAIIAFLAKPSAAIDPKYFEFAMSNLSRAQKLYREWISTQMTAHRRIRQTSIH